MTNQFGKSYKLCSKTAIDDIFESGQTLKSYPFVLKYGAITLDTYNPFQIVISAPKRTFRHAYQRNRIKRLCKEVIRNRKNELETTLIEQNKQIGLFLIYTGKEELTFKQLETKIDKLFTKLIERIQ